MKFSKYFLIGLAALGLASCQQDTGDLGKEQKNPAEGIIDAAQLQLSLAPEMTGSTINLNDYYMQNNAELPDHLMIPAVKIDGMGDIPESTKLSYEMQFASNASYTDAVGVALEGEKLLFYDLETVYQKLYSDVCFDTKEIYVRVAVEGLTAGNTRYRFGGEDYYYLSGSKITVSPVRYASRVLAATGVNTLGMADRIIGRVNEGKHEFAGFLYITAPFTLKDVVEGGIELGMGADGKLQKGSATPIAVPAGGAGLYFLMSKEESATVYSLKLTKVTSAGCIGAFNDWSGDAALTPSDNGLLWNGEVNFAKAGDWKIRFNGGWDIALGNDMNNLSPFEGVSNVSLATAGVYNVALDLRTLPYTVKLTAK